MDLELSSLMQDVMNSKIATLLYESMGTQQAESRRMPDSTRRAFLSRMRSDAVVSRQGAQNMEDASAMVTTAQTGVTAIKQMLTDMRRIAIDVVTYASTLTTEQFASYTAQLQDYVTRMVGTADSTQFNSFKLLNGTAGMNRDGVFQLQAGNSSVQEVLVNMLNSAVPAGQVLDSNGNINLRNMSTLVTMTDATTAQSTLDLVSKVFEYVSLVEARYGNDIRSLDNLKVLLEGQADIFDNVQTYHEGSNQTAAPTSYLDLLMNSGLVNGTILSGRG